MSAAAFTDMAEAMLNEGNVVMPACAGTITRRAVRTCVAMCRGDGFSNDATILCYPAKGDPKPAEKPSSFNDLFGMIPHDERPVLASRAGQYNEALPLPALRAHFQCVWTHSVAGQRATRIAVVPDGCVDLLWRDSRFVVVGPDISAANTVLSPGRTVVGLRFRPGAAAQWLGLPLTEIVGREVPMAELWGRRADRVAERLGEVSSAREQALIFQELLADSTAAFDQPPREASAIFEFLSTIAESDSNKIASLHDRVNMSERTLRRWSIEHFGYGLKTLDRILRFQKFRALALAGADDRLAGLAFGAGYSDQAHLSREIQALCGMTAGEFVRQLTG